MICRSGALNALVLGTALSVVAHVSSANAAELPAIKLSPQNKMPACVTPGRLDAFLTSRNGNANERFQNLAASYMRVGEELQVRWDIAFFQMLLETGNLKFTGDVSEKQNNFAGLGATGRKEPGESFPDVETGVRAHLQHVLMYSGETIATPVAERTRNVQDWKVLADWQKTIKGPMTFAQLAKKWAPTSRGYVRDIQAIAEAFYTGPCKADDPRPELLALARDPSGTSQAAVKTAAAAPEKISGADLARRANEEARASGSFVRSSLGGGSLVGADASPPPVASSPSVKILNAPLAPETQPLALAAPAVVPAAVEPSATVKSAKNPPAARKDAKIQTAALGPPAKSVAATTRSLAAPAVLSLPAAPPAESKCRVWTASYGGVKSVIIKAAAEQGTNYTVLEVNEGAEKREAEAYIAAYARGGETVGEFGSQGQAMDKAFELCPEG